MSASRNREATPPRPMAAQIARMAADMVILTAAFVIGICIDHVWRTKVRHEQVPALSTWIGIYLPSVLLLLLIGLIVFTLNGFYSRGRTYRGRYKALVVTEATVMTFLAYAAVAYALRAYLTFPPATVIAVSGLVAIVLLIAARLYSSVWKNLLVHPVEDADLRRDMNRRRKTTNRVLVIGGGGYIGSALVPQLLNAGYTVRVFDSFMFGRGAIAAHLGHPNLEVVEGDFRRIDQLVENLWDTDSVVHLGGIVGDPACALDEELTVEVNLTSTRTIAEVAKAQGIEKFIFASTCSVYGASDAIMDERSMLNPVSLYAKSKIGSERVLDELADGSFRPTILRFGTVYGLSGRTRFDLVVNLLTAKAVVDSRITVFGPDQWRPFVHVSDVAQAILLALQAPIEKVGSRVYNVGSNAQNTTLGDLGELIKAQVPSAELIVSGADGDRRNYRVNFDRLHNELGFTPKWTLEAGVEQVLHEVRSGNVTEYSGEQYSNVKWLQSLVDSKSVETSRVHHLNLLDSETGFGGAATGTTGSPEWLPEGNEIG